MEINQVFNSELKETLANTAIGILLENNLITEEDFKGLGVEFGYMFTTEEEQLEALFKVFFGETRMYFAAQKGKLMMLNISDDMYAETIEYMKANHPCLSNDELPESKQQQKRREKNNKFLKKNKISFSEKLMTRWEDSSVKIKHLEMICKRAVACFFVIQIACDIAKDDYEESVKFFKPMLEQFGVMDYLNSKENRILDGTYSTQDAIDMDWAYEAYWSLCWALGLVKDIKEGSEVCDCQKAIDIMMSCKSTEEFMKKCKLRSTDEILDMLDLYYRYNWAINDAKVCEESSIGNLNPSVVIERRRGLEWLVSEEDDWYEIDMRA